MAVAACKLNLPPGTMMPPVKFNNVNIQLLQRQHVHHPAHQLQQMCKDWPGQTGPVASAVCSCICQ
jgi:hypothetical protein